ncbi:MAG: DUF819 family protein [Bdellovibrionales bacterium]|nr:DUF819 family protein [Bdellovibrionales bacterium]
MTELRVLVSISLVVVLSLFLEKKYRWARSFGSVLLAITLGIVFSNLNLLPHTSAMYDGIFSYVVPMAIFFILLGVRIDELRKAGPTMLLAFALGSITVLLGVFMGLFFFYGFMGENAHQIAAVFTGTYIGGRVNFVAIGTALNVPADILAGAAAADNVTTALWMIVCIVVPKHLLKQKTIQRIESSDEFRQDISLLSFASLLALGIFVLYLSSIKKKKIAFIPSILWVTTFTLICAQFNWVKKLQGAEVLGHYAILLFFVAIGALCDVETMIQVGPFLFAYTLMIVGVHGGMLWFINRWTKLPLASIVLASQACIGGAPSAVSLAKSLGWQEYTASAAAIGILGYAVGNYFGFLVSVLVQNVLV